MPFANRRSLCCLAITLGVLLPPSFSRLFSQSNQGAKEKEPPVFRVPVKVVVVNATVTDKDGNPVKDLSSNDFRIYDNGRLQSIQTFAMEFPDAGESAVSPPTPAQPLVSAPTSAPSRLNSLPRTLSIVIDDLTMENALDFGGVLDAVKEFINREMNPGDQVALLSGSRRVQVPFSDNKQHLLEELASIPEKLNAEGSTRWCGPELTDLEAQVIARDPAGAASTFSPQLSEMCAASGISLPVAALRQNAEGEFRTHSLLQTLRLHIRALRHFRGFKSVVLFSDGLVAEKGTDSAYKLQEVIDLALHSGIILNAVSTRGIQVYMDAMFASPRADNDEDIVARRVVGASWKALARDSRWKMLVHEDDKRGQERPLVQMASDTGGMFHGGNFIDKGLRDIVRRQVGYYVLTYILPPQETDSAYHTIKLELTRPGLQLSYRKGYYTPKEELSFETRRKEDIIAALDAPGNMNEIPMTLSYNYYQEDDVTYSVSFISGVTIRDLQFFEEDSRRKNLISLILAAYDESDRYISGVEKSIDFRLLEESYAGLRIHGIKSGIELKLPMGLYKIKAVVREGNQGKMGSIAKMVAIP